MELHQVRYFLAVVDARNFTRAAERCSVSQPALTKAIKKLEAEFDGPLLYRDRGGPKLTTLGEVLLPRLRALAELSDTVVDIAENHRTLRSIPLRVAVLRTIGPTWISAQLERFVARAPGVELEVRVLGPSELLSALEEGSLELAITNAEITKRDWMVVKALYAERYVVALPPGHAFAAREQICLRELDGERYIDRLACELSQSLTSCCAELGFELYATHRSSEEGWIESLVRAGIGLALLPEHSLISADTLRRELIEPSISRTIALVRNVDSPVSPAAKLFWDTILSSLPAPP